MNNKSKTYAIDFDGVIHKYSKGWQDGSIYDDPVPGVFDAIRRLIEAGHSVFVFSTRSKWQIKSWLKFHCYRSEYDRIGMGGDPGRDLVPSYGFTVKCIPWWKKFWNEKNVLGITKRKLPAECYIDDRAVRFDGDWDETLKELSDFKTYQQ